MTDQAHPGIELRESFDSPITRGAKRGPKGLRAAQAATRQASSGSSNPSTFLDTIINSATRAPGAIIKDVMSTSQNVITPRPLAPIHNKISGVPH